MKSDYSQTKTKTKLNLTVQLVFNQISKAVEA